MKRPSPTLRRPAARATPKAAPKAAAGAAGWFTIPAFVLLYAACSFWGTVPYRVGLFYLASSGVCAVAYAWDKSAAQAGRWRTQESTLLLLGLVGGWPGAIVAQQVLRHKTSKRSFRLAFWCTVLLNGLGFVALALAQTRGFAALLR